MDSGPQPKDSWGTGAVSYAVPCFIAQLELRVYPCLLFTAFFLLLPSPLDSLCSAVSCPKLQALWPGYKKNPNPISLDPRQLHQRTLSEWRQSSGRITRLVMGSWDHGPVFRDISATQEVKLAALMWIPSALGPTLQPFLSRALSGGKNSYLRCTICRKELLPENSSGEWWFSCPHPVGNWL